MGCCSSLSPILRERKQKELQLINDPKHLSIRSNRSIRGITPYIGFVVKTRKPNNSKAFINIFFHPYLKKMYPIPGLESYDKSGDKCVVFGVVVPSSDYNKSGVDSTIRNKICKEAILLINSNFSENLSLEFTTPKISRGYVGENIGLDIPNDYLLVRNRTASKTLESVAEIQRDSDTVSLIPGGIEHKAYEEENVSIEPTANVDNQTPVKLNDVLDNPVQEPIIVETQSNSSEETSSKLSQNKNIEKNNDNILMMTSPVKLSIEPISRPEMIKTWAQKKGHINTAFKTRYFVLNNGILEYYNESKDSPPYGTNLKGSLHLVGYRVREPSSPDDELSLIIEPKDTNTTSESTRITSSPRNSVSRKSWNPFKSTGDEGLKDLYILFTDKGVKKRWLEAINHHIQWADENLDVNLSLKSELEPSRSSSDKSKSGLPFRTR